MNLCYSEVVVEAWWGLQLGNPSCRRMRQSGHDSLNYLPSNTRTHIPLSHQRPAHSLWELPGGGEWGWRRREEGQESEEKRKEKKEQEEEGRQRYTGLLQNSQGWMPASLATDKLSQIAASCWNKHPPTNLHLPTPNTIEHLSLIHSKAHHILAYKMIL